MDGWMDGWVRGMQLHMGGLKGWRARHTHTHTHTHHTATYPTTHTDPSTPTHPHPPAHPTHPHPPSARTRPHPHAAPPRRAPPTRAQARTHARTHAPTRALHGEEWPQLRCRACRRCAKHSGFRKRWRVWQCSRVAAYLQCFEPSLNSSSSDRAGCAKGAGNADDARGRRVGRNSPGMRFFGRHCTARPDLHADAI